MSAPMYTIYAGPVSFSRMEVEKVTTQQLDAEQGEFVDLLGDAPDWQERALCSQTDPEAFFPDKGGSTKDAKRICGRCEVKTECLEYALRRDERWGVWGGLSERERRKLKRRVA